MLALELALVQEILNPKIFDFPIIDLDREDSSSAACGLKKYLPAYCEC
jgi:hypothetical protein